MISTEIGECGTMTYTQLRAWSLASGPGDYLAKYEDMSSESDLGSRCGYTDEEIGQAKKWLATRDLSLVTDDVGIVVE
jgi:hypothetical protein